MKIRKLASGFIRSVDRPAFSEESAIDSERGTYGIVHLARLKGKRKNVDALRSAASIARRAGWVFGSKHSAECFSNEMISLGAERQEERYDGKIALVAIVARLSADELFAKLKQGTYAQRANHTFKDPPTASPAFLKSTHRVEALVFLLMSLTLHVVLHCTHRTARRSARCSAVP